MGEIEVEEKGLKEVSVTPTMRLLKAVIVTVIVGITLLFIWIVISSILAAYPEYLTCFAVFIWAMLFFTFVIRVCDGTIYKYGFMIARALFLIIYIIYATNSGILTLDFLDFHFTAEFIPILALMIMINLLDIAKGVLEALEFTSEGPKE